MSIMFNEICINEEMLPKYIYIYIYIIYIYIYIYVPAPPLGQDMTQGQF